MFPQEVTTPWSMPGEVLWWTNIKARVYHILALYVMP